MTTILIIAIIILVILWLTNRKKLQTIINELTNSLAVNEKERKNLSDQLTDINQNNIVLAGQVSELEQKNAALNKYQGVVDTEKKANEILSEAEKNANSIIDNAKQQLDIATLEANELKLQAQKELDQASISANTIKTQANIDAIAFKQNAVAQLDNATKEAKLIIEHADKKAQEIAGDAYKAMQNATELEKTAKAMKNIIEGYGDRYLIPTYSILDDLAEEFGLDYFLICS